MTTYTWGAVYYQAFVQDYFSNAANWIGGPAGTVPGIGDEADITYAGDFVWADGAAPVSKVVLSGGANLFLSGSPATFFGTQQSSDEPGSFTFQAATIDIESGSLNLGANTLGQGTIETIAGTVVLNHGRLGISSVAEFFTQIDNFGSVSISGQLYDSVSYTTFRTGGSSIVNTAPGPLINEAGGTITVDRNSAISLVNDLDNSGTITVNAGAVSASRLVDAGIVTLQGGSTLSVGALISGASGAGELRFADAAGETLQLTALLASHASFAPSVVLDGFQAGDTIELTQFGLYGASVSFAPGDGNTGVLTVSDATRVVAVFQMSDVAPDTQFLVTAGPLIQSLGPFPGGVQTGTSESFPSLAVVATAACFLEGTRISTLRGEVPVETVRPGDRCRLADGGTRPVVWVGRQKLDVTDHPAPVEIVPVRVHQDAFGPGRPSRDLLLSPDHCVFVANVLIPVRCLIDGIGITHEWAIRHPSYFHIELDAHDLLLAEGLAVESYIDSDDRMRFDNVGDGPDIASDRPRYPEPRARLRFQGVEVERARSLINAARLLEPAAAGARHP